MIQIAMREHTVGQAVVTDPLLDGASGYAMTAVSESVAAEDRAHLTEMHQVSDSMHTETNPGRFLSFHQLPSGSWALSHRFVHGTRRRAYNRVVVHTLVVSPELLEDVLCDAWLLVAGCRYCNPAGQWRMFTELAEQVREPDVREVEDLPVQLPDDPLFARYHMLRVRSDFLKRHLGSPEALRNALGQILGAVEKRLAVLLPQEAAMEQLLALAWAILPRQDRLRTPWTTHLATGGGKIFRLALTPRPNEALLQQSQQEQWFLPRFEESEPGYGGAGEVLAEAVVDHFDQLPVIDKGFLVHRLSLNRPAEVVGWVHWTLDGGQLPPQGFADARELLSFLDRQQISGEASLRMPWLAPRLVLESVALTAVNQYRRSGSRPEAWNEAIQAVSEVLSARQLGIALLDEDHLAEIIGEAVDSRGAQAAMGALALFLASPDWEPHRESRQRLLAALQARTRERGALAPVANLEATPVFSRFAESVVQLAPDNAEAAYELVKQNGGLSLAFAALEPRLPYLIHLKSILQVARKSGDKEVAGKVARDFLVPLLAKAPAQARQDGLGKAVLDALRSTPAGLEQAFLEWKDDDLYDEAVRTLQQWAREKSPGALAVAARLASDTFIGIPDLIRGRRSILGISHVLAEAGTQAAHWLAFALVEADLVEETGDPGEIRSFREFLSRAPITGNGLEPPLERLIARFHRQPPVRLGAAHRALVMTLAGPLSQRPPQAAAALAQLTSHPYADLLLWGEAVSAVAGAVAKAGDSEVASQIARNWWMGLRIGNFRPDLPDPLPASTLLLLDLLTRKDAESVLAQWVPKISSLDRNDTIRTFLEKLQGLARRYDIPGQEFLCAVGRMAWTMRHEGGDLTVAVAETVNLASALGQTEIQLAGALPRLLPVGPVEKARKIFGLLLSPHLHPEIKALVEKRFLHQALEIPGGPVQVLPPVEGLARHNSLFLEVSKKMGRSWRDFPDATMAFVRSLIELERSDALGVLLRAAGEDGGPSFLRHLEDRAPDLYRVLREAARHPVGRWDLSRIKTLRE